MNRSRTAISKNEHVRTASAGQTCVRPSPGNPKSGAPKAPATLRDTRLPKLLSRELSRAAMVKEVVIGRGGGCGVAERKW